MVISDRVGLTVNVVLLLSGPMYNKSPFLALVLKSILMVVCVLIRSKLDGIRARIIVFLSNETPVSIWMYENVMIMEAGQGQGGISSYIEYIVN